MEKMRPPVAIGIGFIVGVLNGLLAAGGTLLVPAMVHILHMGQRDAHGTSLWVILPTSLVSLGFYLSSHGLDTRLGWQVAAGGALGGLIGARLMRFVPALVLKRLFAAFMLIAGVRMALA